MYGNQLEASDAKTGADAAWNSGSGLPTDAVGEEVGGRVLATRAPMACLPFKSQYKLTWGDVERAIFLGLLCSLASLSQD